jgi:hypothetical protein
MYAIGGTRERGAFSTSIEGTEIRSRFFIFEAGQPIAAVWNQWDASSRAQDAPLHVYPTFKEAGLVNAEIH